MRQAKLLPLLVLVSSLFPAPSLSAGEPIVVPLWEGCAPGAKAYYSQPERPVTGHEADGWIEEINDPSLTVYLPAEGTAKGRHRGRPRRRASHARRRS